MRDRLKLMLSHYSCLAKQELTKAVIQLACLRRHYAFQGEPSTTFPPLLKELYVEKQMPEVEFELPISTDHTTQRIVNTR